MTSTSGRSAALAASAACAAACAFQAPICDAQERLTQERLTLRASYAYSWDDNAFRLPEGAPDPEASRGIAGKSDRFSATEVGLRVDVPISLQRILLELSAAAVRYEKFESLDQDPFIFRGVWQWQLSPRFGGTLIASRAETGVRQEDVRGTRSIDQRTTAVVATADAWISGGWHLLGGISETEWTYSDPFLAQPNTTQTTAEAGLRWIARSGNQVTLTGRTSDGTETVTDPAIFGGGDFSQDELEASATWIASGHSTLHGRVTRIERRHKIAPQRDFSGTAGDLRYEWRPTGKLHFNLSANRSIAPYILAVGSTVRVDDTATAALLWQVGHGTALRSGVSRQQSRFGQQSTSSEPSRRDRTDSVEVGAKWSPLRSIALDARLRHERRDSTDATQVFDANTATVSLTLTF